MSSVKEKGGSNDQMYLICWGHGSALVQYKAHCQCSMSRAILEATGRSLLDLPK
jgi:hypothetical protein